MPTTTSVLISDLAGVVGDQYVIWKPEDLLVYEYDGSIDRATPQAVVLPGSAEEVADLSGEEWELVGVNNRDLRTFKVDLGRSMARITELPEGALHVAESGIAGRSDIETLAAAGFDAFLIGEALVTDPAPAARLQELLGGPSR